MTKHERREWKRRYRRWEKCQVRYRPDTPEKWKQAIILTLMLDHKIRSEMELELESLKKRPGRLHKIMADLWEMEMNKHARTY